MTTEELRELGMNTGRRDESTVVYLPHLHYAIEAWPYDAGHDEFKDAYAMEFMVYECSQWTKGNESGYGYHKKGSPRHPDPVETLDEAEWYIRGGLKWDGCVNYGYNDEWCMLHGCGLGDRRREAELWAEVYRLGSVVLAANWSSDDAE